jgi:hypothetical protein
MRLVMACFQGAFSGCATFGLPLAPLTLLLPASPLAIYSLCPLHSGIRTGAGVIFLALPRRFAMLLRLQGALLPYAAFAPSSGIGLGIRPLAPQL